MTIRASYDLSIGDVTQHWEIEAPSQGTLVTTVTDALMRLVNETATDATALPARNEDPK